MDAWTRRRGYWIKISHDIKHFWTAAIMDLRFRLFLEISGRFLEGLGVLRLCKKLHPGFIILFTMADDTERSDPPTSWAPVYERIAENDGLQWRTLVEVTAAVQSFLDPVLAGNAASWHSESWSWSEATGGDEP